MTTGGAVYRVFLDEDNVPYIRIHEIQQRQQKWVPPALREKNKAPKSTRALAVVVRTLTRPAMGWKVEKAFFLERNSL